MDKSRIPFPQLRAAFGTYNRTTNKSLPTVAWHDQRLDLFERHLGPPATLADVNVDNVRAFIANLQGRTRRYENNRFVDQNARHAKPRRDPPRRVGHPHAANGW